MEEGRRGSHWQGGGRASSGWWGAAVACGTETAALREGVRTDKSCGWRAIRLGGRGCWGIRPDLGVCFVPPLPFPLLIPPPPRPPPLQAHSISWAIHEVLCDPALGDRLRAELAAALPPPPAALTPATLPGLPLATAVWRETLRAHPPGALGARRRLASDTVLPSDGAVLPAGTVVAAPPYTLHHDAGVYAQPEVFDPGRWLGVGPRALGGGGGGNGDSGGGCEGGGGGGGRGADPARAARAAMRAARNSWLPFGTGGRGCPGVAVARVEWHAVMAALLRRYDWTRAGGPVRAAVETTLRPDGLRVVFTKRKVQTEGTGRGDVRRAPL